MIAVVEKGQAKGIFYNLTNINGVKGFIKLPAVRIALALLLPLAVCFFYDIDLLTLKYYIKQPKAMAAFSVVTVIFIASVFLSALRLFLVYRQFKTYLNYNMVLRATIVGQISSVIPMFGTMLGHGVYLYKKTSVPSTISSFVLLYDKACMAAAGLICALMAGFSILGPQFLQNISFKQPFLHVVIIACLTLIAVIWKGINKQDRAVLFSLLSYRNIAYLLTIFLTSVCSWVCAACAFLMPLILLGPAAAAIKLLPASLIVSFLSSLPISINGWGIREFAAVKVFSLFNIPKELALFTAITVGFFSLVALFIISIIYGVKDVKTEDNKIKVLSFMQFINLEKSIVYFLACCMAVLIFFQLQVHWDKIKININIADIIALSGFVMAVIMLCLQNSNIYFKIKATPLYILAFILAFAMSLVVSMYTIGFSKFAFINKFLGFFVLLGYASIGAFFIKYNGQKGYSIIVRLMTTTLLVILLFRFALIILINLNFISITFFQDYMAGGYANNTNAFALQILLVIAIRLAVLRQAKTRFWSSDTWITSIFLLGVYLTKSRAGMLAALSLLAIFSLLRIINPRYLLILILQTILVLAISYLIMQIICYFSTLLSKPAQVNNALMFTSSSLTSSNTERWYTILAGLKLLATHPLLGSGLGSFVYEELARNGRFLVIHSTFVWLLAEFGVLGSAVFFIYGYKILQYLYKIKNGWRKNSYIVGDKMLCGFIILFIVTGMVHEMFYHRFLWFIWGLAIVDYKTRKRAEQNII